MLLKKTRLSELKYIQQQKQIYGLRKSRQELLNKVEDLQKIGMRVSLNSQDIKAKFEGGR